MLNYSRVLLCPFKTLVFHESTVWSDLAHTIVIFTAFRFGISEQLGLVTVSYCLSSIQGSSRYLKLIRIAAIFRV